MPQRLTMFYAMGRWNDTVISEDSPCGLLGVFKNILSICWLFSHFTIFFSTFSAFFIFPIFFFNFEVKNVFLQFWNKQFVFFNFEVKFFFVEKSLMKSPYPPHRTSTKIIEKLPIRIIHGRRGIKRKNANNYFFYRIWFARRLCWLYLCNVYTKVRRTFYLHRSFYSTSCFLFLHPSIYSTISRRFLLCF